MKFVAPETRYARSGDVSIAYQVTGTGSQDLICVPSFISHLEFEWEHPVVADFLNRLGSFTRLIRFDKRGTGLSDRVSGIASLEERMDDLRAILDDVSSRRAAIFGSSEGAALAALFAATYPDRTSALILCGGLAKAGWSPECGKMLRTPEESAERWAKIQQGWPEAFDPDLTSPSLADDPGYRQWLRTYLRVGASPGAAVAVLRMNAEIDLRGMLPSIRVPTLVLHARGDARVPLAQGRYLASHIPGAKYVELPCRDHYPWGDGADQILAEIAEFLTGTPSSVLPDRVLATLLVTDIVGSTERQQALGDRDWRALLSQHHAVVRRALARHRGREIDNAGDGFLARFDGPARAIRCACEIRDAMSGLGLIVRAGVHTGECEILGDKLSGIAVHIGSRVASTAAPSEVLVTGAVRDLVAGAGIAFADRGRHALRGLEGEWHLYSVVTT